MSLICIILCVLGLVKSFVRFVLTFAKRREDIMINCFVWERQNLTILACLVQTDFRFGAFLVRSCFCFDFKTRHCVTECDFGCVLETSSKFGQQRLLYFQSGDHSEAVNSLIWRQDFFSIPPGYRTDLEVRTRIVSLVKRGSLRFKQP